MERLKEIPMLKLEILNFTRGLKNLLYQRKFLAVLRDYVIKNDINLIHTHHRFPEYMSVKAVKGLDIKTVTSAHSFVSGFKKISFMSDKIIAVSKAVGSYVKKKFNIEEEKIITLYNPAEEFPEINLIERQRIKTEIGIGKDLKVLLFMGRFNEVKGYDTLLKSFKTINEKRKDVILLMCGDIEDRKLERIGIPPNMKLLSPRRNNFLLYSIADVVVLPSRVDPFPLVMIEAGNFKKPFIGGNTGGIAEFIEDNVNGLLVNPGNDKELVEKIIYLLDNKERADSLGNNLYKKVKEKCDYDKYFQKVEEIYNSLISL